MVPRGGGARGSDSFDTIDRYKQHAIPKRYDPNRESFIHTTQVRWRNYHGCVKVRDQKGVNSDVYIPWDKVTTEPPAHRSMLCKCSWYFGLCRHVIRSPWEASSSIFHSFSRSCYSCLSCPSVLFISMFCGIYFGFLTFLHIWAVQPMKRMMKIMGVLLKGFSQAFLGELVASLTHVWSLMFATKNL